jgi:hypothetical protein
MNGNIERAKAFFGMKKLKEGEGDQLFEKFLEVGKSELSSLGKVLNDFREFMCQVEEFG